MSAKCDMMKLEQGHNPHGSETIQPQLLAAETALVPAHFSMATLLFSHFLRKPKLYEQLPGEKNKRGFGGLAWTQFLPTPAATFSRTTRKCRYEISQHQTDSTALRSRPIRGYGNLPFHLAI